MTHTCGRLCRDGVVAPDGLGFDVMNVQLVLGTHLRFDNSGRKTLKVDIDTWRGIRVRQLSVPAHGTAEWTPEHYGVYDYFNAGTTDFSGVKIDDGRGGKVYQVVARHRSANFPDPGYGVVVVTNRRGGGIPLSADYGSAEVPDPRQGRTVHAFMDRPRAWMEISSYTMTFKPWVLVVRAGQPIGLYNEDGMNHAFFPGSYPVMYDDRGHLRWYRDHFRGFVLHKDGGHRVVRFYRPGVHHVFCILHASPWRHTYRPHRMAGNFPYVMDAVIVVEPRPSV
ncbi:hypothetical protein [Acidihalobacter aeolianus]|uniref:hypothetical protein n=1 Tax=Acidihalobacter aeolianus TaxID=2792603 RepID=UPI0012EA103A|nr:hypothetical protein [Acidihalobacter aeolianus]